jgi:DsbE subfamily thiol:disulfide oxidoreductase
VATAVEAAARAVTAVEAAAKRIGPAPARRRVGRLVATILVASMLASGCSGDPALTGPAPRDEPLPRLAGETVTGEPIDAHRYADGDVLVVNVWADWCDPCRREQPALVDLARRYRDRGVRFLGINYQDDRHAARAWIETYDVPYPSLFDPSGATAVDLGFPALPDTYVVDRDGTIRWVVFGATDEAELGGLIDDVLS